MAQAVQPILARFEASTPQPAGTPPPVDDIEQEIRIREQQLAQCETGEIDPKYRPAIQSALSSAIARKEGRAIVERESARGGFVGEYNNAVALAHQEFPELKDATTELSKETVNILKADRSHARVAQALNTRGREAEKVDWGSLDPMTVYNAACKAKVIIDRRNAGRPLSQQAGTHPRAANAALEAGAGALPTGDEGLAQLEAKAVESGQQHDWQRYIKARDQRLQQRRAAAV